MSPTRRRPRVGEDGSRVVGVMPVFIARFYATSCVERVLGVFLRASARASWSMRATAAETGDEGSPIDVERLRFRDVLFNIFTWK